MSDSVTTWYTADLHFGHRNIITYCERPWPTTDEMDSGLIKRWNASVGPSDAVWVLGDVALSPKAIWPVSHLNGHKILVAGNHDACWDRHKGYRNKIDAYQAAGFSEIHASGVVDNHKIGQHDVRLAHLPYAGDHTERDRYADRRPPNDGRPLICGHVHTLWRTNGRQINVGVDVWDYAPVAAKTLAELLDDLAL